MARIADDENPDDQKITLSENEGVDEEDLKAPSGSDRELDNEPTAEKAADLKEEEVDSDVSPEDSEERRELHRPRAEADEPIEDLSRTAYPSSTPEDSAPSETALRPEHTLNDLAEEDSEMSVPIGVDPTTRPKSFRMAYDEDEPGQYGSNIPHIGSQYSPPGAYSTREPGNKRGGGFKTILLLVIAVIVLGGAVYLLKGKSLLNKFSSSPTPTPSPVVENSTPEPSPSPSFDRSQFTVDVLNGSGKTGLAASISAQLSGLGYKAGKTGNATNSAFTRTQVLVKSGDSDLLQNLINDLAPALTATDGGLLKDSSTADGEVIIGAK